MDFNIDGLKFRLAVWTELCLFGCLYWVLISLIFLETCCKLQFAVLPFCSKCREQAFVNINIIILPVSDSTVSSRPNNVLGVSPSATFFLLLNFYGSQSLPPIPLPFHPSCDSLEWPINSPQSQGCKKPLLFFFLTRTRWKSSVVLWWICGETCWGKGCLT